MSQQTTESYTPFVAPAGSKVINREGASYTTLLGADGKPLDYKTERRSSSEDLHKEKRNSKEYTKERRGSDDKEKRRSSEMQRSESMEKKTEPKDVELKLGVHSDENGRKEIDAKFHFEGKRSEKPEDDKDKSSKKELRSSKDDNEHSSKSEKAGGILTKVGEKIQEKAEERQAKKENTIEIIEPKNAATHEGGLGQKIVQKIKAKVGEAMQDTAADLLVRNPGDQPRDLDASIKHRLEAANRLEREAFVEEQIANDHNLRRAERKEAKKRAADAKYRAKVEVATAEAEKHVLENHATHTHEGSAAHTHTHDGSASHTHTTTQPTHATSTVVAPNMVAVAPNTTGSGQPKLAQPTMSQPVQASY